MFTIKIDGNYLPTGVVIKDGSLTINHGKSGEITVLEFNIVDKNLDGSTYAYQTLIGQKIELYEDGILKFGGQLDEPETRKINNHPIFGSKIIAVDWTSILDRVFVNNSYARNLISNVFKDIIDTYLVPEGFFYNASDIQETTGQYISINCPYSRCSDVFDELADLVNFQWIIAPNKRIYFNDRTVDQGTSIIENQSNYIPKSLSCRKDRSEYFNKKIFQNVNAITDELTEKCTPTPDNDKAFFVSFPINSKPTLFITQNIDNPATSEVIDSRWVGISGLDTGLKYYWNKGSNIINQDESEEIPGGYFLVAKYFGQYKIDVVKQDSSAIAERISVEGGTGVYTNISDGSHIETLVVAEEKSQALIDKYARIAEKIMLSSYTIDLEIGQICDTVFPSFKVNSLVASGAGYLVMSKRTDDVGAANLVKTYTLIDGAAVGGWIKFFKKWISGESNYTIRENAIVSVPVSSSDELEWDGEVELKQFTILVPSNTLYPTNVLYPGTLNKTTTYSD